MHSLGESIPSGKAVQKLQRVLPSSWESKVKAITEARDLDILTMDDLTETRSLTSLKRIRSVEVTGEWKDRNMLLKANEKNYFEEENMALIIRRFQKMLRTCNNF